MSVRIGRPESVTLPPCPTWRDGAGTAVHHLARDFATQAWSNSRKVNGELSELETMLRRVRDLPGSGDLFIDIEALVSCIAQDVSNLAAEIGVEVAQRFKPDDLWRTIATDYGEWPDDWAEPRPAPKAGGA